MVQNYSPTGYVSDGCVMPVKLGITEVTNGPDLERGCVAGNIGSRRQVGDRVFYLATSVVTTVAGSLYCADTSSMCSAELLNGLTAASAGATSVTLTATASGAWAAATTAVEDYYAGDYLVISNGTGEGYCYRIRGNDAAAGTGAALAAVLHLYDSLAVAVTTSTDCVLVRNPYKVPIIAGTTTDFLPLGVCCAVGTYASATGPVYFWLQTWGPASVLSAGMEAAGSILYTGASGASAIQAGYDRGTAIGTRLVANTANSDLGAAYLTIRP